MEKIMLGKTGLLVNRSGFGALPIQRITTEEAATLLRRARDGGINYFDTARSYSDSEEKIAKAFAGGDWPLIATKTMAKKAETFWDDLHSSLRRLGRDCVDVYQFHNPKFCPLPGGEDGLYDAALEARRQGKIRFIGITNHRRDIAKQAVESDLYDVLQFPFSYLSNEEDLSLIELCKIHQVGCTAMKALSGGLIQNARAAYAFLASYDNLVPLWGVQRAEELEEILSLDQNPPMLDEALLAVIEKDRQELQGDFCRGCGYCMPCPVDIPISNAARMSLLLRRSPSAQWLTPQWQQDMAKIENCFHCRRCSNRCPYGLDTPELLRRNWEDYQTFLK